MHPGARRGFRFRDGACVCAVSAVINSTFRPLDLRKMITTAAVMAALAFASVFAVVNYVLDQVRRR